MATIKVRYLVSKPGVGGAMRYYWQPSKALYGQGWRAERLDNDRATAIARAERLNADLDAYRTCGRPTQGSPAEADPSTESMPGAAADSLDALIGAYKQSPRFKRLRASTRRGYAQNLAIISRWAGTETVKAVTTRSVQKWYEHFYPSRPSLANAVIGMLRILMEFARRQGLVLHNPVSRPGLISTPPRQAMWTEAGLDAFVRAADAAGHASIGTAVMLAAFLGQREGDILKLTWSCYERGVFRFQQRKTGQWIDVPAVPELAARLAATERTAPAIVVAESTGRPYRPDHFRHAFAAVRRIAAAEVPEIAKLWFMDLRRTGVVWLAEAGCTTPQIASITGHQIDSCQRILETYLPRTSKMAAAAIEKLTRHRASRGKQERK